MDIFVRSVRRIGRFISDMWKTWMESPHVVRCSFLVFELCLSVLAIMIGIHYEAFAENGRCMLFLPYIHLKEELNEEVALSEIRTASRVQEERLYIFVLDCSASVDQSFPGEPSWYGSAVRKLKMQQYDFEVPLQATAHSVSKVALYFMLHALVRSVEDLQSQGLTNRFAVWDVCGGSMKRVPERTGAAVVEAGVLYDTIQGIEVDVLPPDEAKLRTSFLELLQGLDKKYEIYENNLNGAQKSDRHLVITILSDFKDDPDGKGTQWEAMQGDDRERKTFFVERQVELARATRNLSSDKITFNLVEVSSPSASSPEVVGLVKKHLRWYRYNEVNILSDVVGGSTRMLYPVEVVDRPLRLWYSNPRAVSGEIRIRSEGGENIGISLPAASEEEVPFELKVGTVVDGNRAKMIRTLRSGEQVSMTKLSPGESVVLRYEGPVRRRPEMLRLFDHRTHRNYLVPTEFVRRLPPSLAMHMMVVISIMIAPIVLLLLYGALGRLRRTGRDAGSSGEGR